MWSINIRLGLPEFFVVASLLAVSGLLAVAVANDWAIALVPGLTYVLAVIVAYAVYRQYASREAEVSRPVLASMRFRVVDTHGECPLGHGRDDIVTVGPAGAVLPEVCAAAERVLRFAATDGGDGEVKEWCCPIFDHMLVFRREVKAA